MTREDAKTKGLRYLTEGRLVLEVVSGQAIQARCRGGGDEYVVAHHPSSGWRCSCPARIQCAHLWALKSVTSVAPRNKESS